MDILDQRIEKLDRHQLLELRRCREVHRYRPTHFGAVGYAADSDHVEKASMLHAESIAHVPPDASLMAFAELATLRLDVDYCVISLIDDKQQYILARTARSVPMQHTSTNQDIVPPLSEDTVIPRDRSIDNLVLDLALHPEGRDHRDSTLIITDTSAYDFPSANLWSADHPQWRFYAGAPLYSTTKFMIGVFSVMNREPRSQELNQQTTLILENLASTTTELLSARMAHEKRLRAEKMIGGLEAFMERERRGSRDTMKLESPSHKAKASPISSHTPIVEESAAHVPALILPQSLIPSAPLQTQNMGLVEIDQTKGASMDTRLIDSQSSTFSSSRQNEAKQRNVQSAASSASGATGFQKSLLPPRTEAMFSRAARIIREAGHFDGVVFVDASVAALGKDYTITDDADDPSHHGEEKRSSSNDRRDSSPSVPGLGRHSNSSDSSIGLSTSTQSDQRKCLVLGSSITDVSVASNVHKNEEVFSLPESVLRRILRFHPHGRIINFSMDGMVIASSSDETSDFPQRQFKAPVGNLWERGSTSKSVSRSLKMILPQARSLCVVPIWNYERSRWFTCCIAWTETPQRILSSEIELVYLKAFGNVIMAELGHLDAVSGTKQKTTFMSSVSHELRSPLHGILGSVGFLQTTDLDAFQAAMLLSIRTCGNTLLDVIDHVLDVTQMDGFQGQSRSSLQIRDEHTIFLSSDKRIVSNPSFRKLSTISNLRIVTEEVVESVFASLSYQVQQSTIDDHDAVRSDQPDQKGPSAKDSGANRKFVLVILELPHDLEAAVDMPAGAWRRILMNLIGNAIKYTSSGHVRIVVSLGDGGTKSDRRTSRITLTVCDTGIGISQDFLANRIFRAFSQEDSFSSGMGLGLHLVRQLVTSLQGTIRIRSVPGRGTNIKVNLDVPKAGIRPCEEGSEDRMTDIKERLASKTICILYNNVSESRFSDDVQVRGAQLFGEAIQQTLHDWFDVKPVISRGLEIPDADIIVMLETSFVQLEAIRNRFSTGKQAPIVLIVAIDAVEAGTLRSDVRISSKRSIVEVISQPCGPLKLSNILHQCLDRRSMLNNDNENPQNLLRAGNGEVPSIGSTLQKSPLHRAASEGGAPRQMVKLGTTKKILIVDDNSINRRLLVALMRKSNIIYIEAQDGLQALRVYQQQHQEISIVLMDISMPVMDGMTSTREIRKFERKNNIPKVMIIALSGLVSVSARLEALESGVDKFLTKPVNFADLKTLMSELTSSNDTSAKSFATSVLESA